MVCGSAWAQEPVRYLLQFPNAQHHEAEIQATFSDLPAAPLEIAMSRSSPGRYALHEFAKNVYNVRAIDSSGKPLSVAQTSTNEWRVAGHDGTVRFSYTLFGDMVDGTFDAIDLTHAHLNGPATFVWARGLEQRPVRVKFEAPFGLEWSVATQLADVGDNWWGAPSRDLLIDSPIEFSAHKIREWKVGDTQFRMVLHSAAKDDDATEYSRYCEAVVAETEGVFGAFPRYDNGRYTILLDYQPYDGSDAMEHRNSTFISNPSELNRRSFVDLIDSVAHEFFHSWNVERMRPKSLEPFDLERANMSSELWFAEGFTNYYGPLVLTRSGIYDLEHFASEMTAAVNALLTSPGRLTANAPEMSRMAPFVDRASNGDPTNQANTFLSYYYYGESLGLGLDLAIRSKFPGKSLDDWMRALWHEHPDVDTPYTAEDLQRALATATDAAFAKETFNLYIDGHELLDYRKLLAQAGLALRKSSDGEVWFGAPRVSFPGRAMVVIGSALKGSPAYVAGIDRGDRIVAVDGKEIKDQREWDRILKSYKPGDQSRLQVEGRSGRRNVGITWQNSPSVEVVTFETIKQPVTPEIKAFRKAWLGSKAIHSLPKLP